MRKHTFAEGHKAGSTVKAENRNLCFWNFTAFYKSCPVYLLANEVNGNLKTGFLKATHK